VLNQSLNIFSMLGILVLFGIVKKNGILQVDHTNDFAPRFAARAGHREANRTVSVRSDDHTGLRGRHAPARRIERNRRATNRAIGSVIIGGQSLALLLTLLATPVAYSLFDDLQERMRSKKEEKVEEELEPVTVG